MGRWRKVPIIYIYLAAGMFNVRCTSKNKKETGINVVHEVSPAAISAISQTSNVEKMLDARMCNPS